MADYVLSAKGTFDGSNFDNGLGKSTNALDKFVDKCKSVNNSTSNAFDGAASRLDSFASKCESVSAKCSGSLTKIVGVAAKVTAAVGGIFTGVVIKGGIDRALNIEQAQYKLRQLGMDVESIMKSANDAVTGTAHALDAAVTTASSLSASGVQAGDSMTRSLQAVAGMATIAGRDMESIGLIFGKVAAQGRLQGDELMQFAESGLNATDALAKYLGKSQTEIRDMVRNAQIDFQTFSDAMYAAFGQAAYGANETFLGALSNVKAALSRMSAKFATPALEALQKVFAGLIPAINTVSGLMDPLVDKFSNFVSNGADRAVQSINLFVAELERTKDPMAALEAVLKSNTSSEFAQGLSSLVSGLRDTVSVGKSVVDWYLSLDAGQQRAIVSAIAFGVAVKPIVGILAGIVGKGARCASTIMKIASTLTNVGANGVLATAGLKNVSNGAEGAAAKASKAATAFNLLKGACTVLAGALAMILVADLAARFMAYTDAVNAAKGATQGFSEAIAAAKSNYSAASSGLDSVSKSTENVMNSSLNALQSQSDLANSFKSTWQDLGATESTLDTYVSTIERLANQSGLTADQQAELVSAVAGVNEICGTSYSVIDAQNGILSASTDAIKQNTEAWINNAKAQAAQNEYVQVQQQHLKNQNEIKAVQEALNKAVAEGGEGFMVTAAGLKDLIGQETLFGIALEDIIPIADEQGMKVSDLQKRLNQLQEADASATDYMKFLEEVMGECQAATEKETQAVNDLSKALNENQAFVDWANTSGHSLDEVAKKLHEFGLNVEDVSGLSVDFLQIMADNWDSSMSDIAQKCSDAGIEVPEAFRKMMESASSAVEDGGAEIVDKTDAVVKNVGESLQELANAGQVDEAGRIYDEFGNVVGRVSEETAKAALAVKGETEKMSGATGEAGQKMVDDAQTINDALHSIGEDSQGVVNNLKTLFDGLSTEFNSIGVSLGNSLSTGFLQADMMDVQLALTNVVTMANERNAEFQAVGTSLGNAVSTGFSMADMMSASLAMDNLIMMITARDPEFQMVGVSLANAIATGFGMADMASVSIAIDNCVVMVSGREGEFFAIGVSLGNSLSTGFASADMGSSAAAMQRMVSMVNSYNGQFQSTGLSHGNALSTGFASADMASAIARMEALMAQIRSYEPQFMTSGRNAGTNYATGISSASGVVSSSASLLVRGALSALSSGVSNAYTYGSHLGGQFAAGISSQASAVAAAAATLAAAAKANVGFTHPEEGPLRHGTEIYGMHLGQNWAKGIKMSKHDVSAAAASLADSVAKFADYSSFGKQETKIGVTANLTKAATRDAMRILANSSDFRYQEPTLINPGFTLDNAAASAFNRAAHSYTPNEYNTVEYNLYIDGIEITSGNEDDLYKAIHEQILELDRLSTTF